jgi:hypothetical protein
MSRNKTRRREKKKGGAATVFPLKYFDVGAKEPSAPAGRDLLEAIPPLGVRPRIGGSRKTRRIQKDSQKRKEKKQKKQKKQKGGFVPSVMGSFVSSTSKYIVPLALFLGYKFMTKKNKKGGRK